MASLGIKNQLLSINTYYGPLMITLCISIMGSFKQNYSLSNFSVTENSKNHKPDQSMSQLISHIEQALKRL